MLHHEALQEFWQPFSISSNVSHIGLIFKVMLNQTYLNACELNGCRICNTTLLLNVMPNGSIYYVTRGCFHISDDVCTPQWSTSWISFIVPNMRYKNVSQYVCSLSDNTCVDVSNTCKIFYQSDGHRRGLKN